ncbi:ThiL Thiamine monophosphate kinase [Candidatus Nanopelagicaceae bacterium]
MGFSESDVISVLKEVFTTTDPRLLVGIGDDAAVVQGAERQVITTDVAVAGVHFRTDWSSPFDIGRKITAANVADVLAMGATCDYLVAAVTLTGTEDLTWIEQLARGMKAEADRARALIVGGDIARSSVITIAMTAVGRCDAPILRSGARAGDDIFISSLTGWSAAGLAQLSKEQPHAGAIAAKAISEFSAPTLDYEFNSSQATALCDISDSLLIQAQQLAAASGVCLHFETELIQSSAEFAELSQLAIATGCDVWDWVLGGGEDHVFLATGKDLPGVRVGRVMSGSGISGIEMKKAPVSWSHFN